MVEVRVVKSQAWWGRMDVRKVLVVTMGCLERPGTQERIDEPMMMCQMNTGKCV